MKCLKEANSSWIIDIWGHPISNVWILSKKTTSNFTFYYNLTEYNSHLLSTTSFHPHVSFFLIPMEKYLFNFDEEEERSVSTS